MVIKGRKHLCWIFLSLGALGWSLLLSGCRANGEQLPFISFHEREAATVSPDSRHTGVEPLRVSVASMTSTRESLRYYKELLDFLAEYLGQPVEMVQRNTYAETNELLRTGAVDLAFVCTYAYVRAHDEFGARLLAVPEIDGATTYQAYIITRKDSGVNDFSDFKGKRFAFTDPLSTTGYLYPLTLLKLQETRPEDFFASHIFTYSHDNSVRAVRDGIVDGASVESQVLDEMMARDPELQRHIRVIQHSPDFSAPPVIVRPGLNEALETRLRDFFLTLHENSRGKAILQNMGIDRYQPATDDDYASVRALGMLVGK